MEHEQKIKLFKPLEIPYEHFDVQGVPMSLLTGMLFKLLKDKVTQMFNFMLYLIKGGYNGKKSRLFRAKLKISGV